ncbi:hypothetical protein CR513_05068, partial [Mucuna pruriens]
MLPKFHGLASEDSHKHLKEFHVVYSTMRLQGIPKEYIKMKAFPFSLDGAAEDWLYLQPVTDHSSKSSSSKQYFYEGLLMMDQNMVDAVSGGALMDKTPAAALTQSYKIQGGAGTSRVVSEVDTVDNLRLENQLIELTSLVRQLAVEQHQQAAQRVCGICTLVEHPTDMCPTLQEDELENTECVGALGGGYQYGRQSYMNRQFDNQQFWSRPILEAFPPKRSRIQKGEESAWCNYEAVENYHSRMSLSRVRDQPEPRPNRELTLGVPLLFPNRTVSTRRSEINEDLLKLFKKVEINILLLDAIKQIPKYAKFLEELCSHKRKKMKGAVEMGRIVSVLVKHEDSSAGLQRILPKKCQDMGIFVVPCTIGDRTFTDAMLDLRASINIMSTSIYKSLNLGDLEPTWMEIQLANRSVVQPLGVLEDILVQVNELILLVDFYVLDMEDEPFGEGFEEPFGEGFALILGRPFFMAKSTKIDVHVGTLSMEFGDTFVKFNSFEALKHPDEDHSIFSIDTIDGLIEDYFRIGTGNANLVDFVNISDVIDCFCTVAAKADFEILSHAFHFPYFEDFISNLIHCRIDEVLGKSQYAKFLVAGTSKSGVTGAATAESDSRI